MKIFGIILIIASVVIYLFKRHHTKKGFSVRSANSATVNELALTAQSVSQEIGGGSWRDYVKVWGVVTSATPLISELKQEPCVYYKMSVCREYEEVVRKRDSDGNWSNETRRGSETVSSNERKISFFVKDDTGTILVDPDQGAIETVKILDEFRQDDNMRGSLSFGAFSLSLGANVGGKKTLGYRYQESILPLGCHVLVVGEVSDETGQLVLRKPVTKKQNYIISLNSPEVLVKKIKQTETILLYSAIASGVIGIILIIMGFK
jgi:hypothetical protein